MPHLMKRQLTAILIGIFLTSPLLGQLENDLKKALSTKDFNIFKNHYDKLFTKDRKVIPELENLRDLTAEFKEGIFILEEWDPEKDNPKIINVYKFRINIIIKKDRIIYYELSERKHRYEDDRRIDFYKQIDVFKDDLSFTDLKTSFYNLYQNDIYEEDLFVVNFVYGSSCGLAGSEPKGHRQIAEWVETKNKIEILKWLQSANTEKQVYAVDGLYKLEKQGIPLTEKEIEVINFIKSKSGKIYICSACSHYYSDISRVFK